MASSSSDPSVTSPLPKISFQQIENVCVANYEQRWMLRKHYMYMDDDIFFYLYQTGLVEQIINVFKMEDCKKQKSDQIKGEKRSYEDIEDDTDKIEDSSKHEELKRKKNRQITVVDDSTQTEDPLPPMVSSSPLPSHPILPVSMSTVTVAPAVNIYADLEKKRYQKSLLVMYKIYLKKCDFSLLESHGLIDQLVQVIQNVEHTKGTSFDQYLSSKGSIVSTTTIIQEGKEEEEEGNDNQEEEEDDEDEDYEFETPSEDKDEQDDDDDQGNQCGCCMFLKEEYEEQNLSRKDAITQTIDN